MNSTLRYAAAIVLPLLLLSSPAWGQHFPPDEDLELMHRYIVEDAFREFHDVRHRRHGRESPRAAPMNLPAMTQIPGGRSRAERRPIR